jgi:phosphoribosyl 1,2-cyclic phosphate phosphodiesterase
MRTSITIEAEGMVLLIDTTPDFRSQALAHNIRQVDAVLLTHTHADHIFGFDDIRRFNTIKKGPIPVYGSDPVISRMREIFDYVVPDRIEPGFFVPLIQFESFTSSFDVGPFRITPLEVDHGRLPTHGFILEHDGKKAGYFPDCKSMEPGIIEHLQGVDIMILDALRHREHPTHLSVEESMTLLGQIQAKESWLIHMCHDLDHEETEAALPETIRLTYDGLILDTDRAS